MKIQPKSIMYLSDEFPLQVKGDVLTTNTNGIDYIVDGFDGEMPYQEVQHGVVGFYRKDYTDSGEGLNLRSSIKKASQSNWFINVVGFIIFLFIIFILTIIVK